VNLSRLREAVMAGGVIMTFSGCPSVRP